MLVPQAIPVNYCRAVAKTVDQWNKNEWKNSCELHRRPNICGGVVSKAEWVKVLLATPLVHRCQS